MDNVTFPSEYQRVMPYLIVPDPGAFIEFAQEVMGASIKMLNRDDSGTYRHCEILVGDSVIMFSATMEGYPARPGGFFVYVGDADKAYAAALAKGARALSEVSDQPYGRSGGVEDSNGNTWWLTTAPGE